jgi:hypothetical protein
MVIKDTIIIRWLVLAALADWLLARTLTRLGIFMPKSPMLISGYQTITAIGQYATIFAGLMVLATVLGWAWRELVKGENKPGAVTMAALVFLSIMFLFVQPSALLGASYQILLTCALAYSSWRSLRSAGSPRVKLAILTTMLALQAGAASHLAQLSGQNGTSQVIFKAGELFVLVSVLFLWMVFGRPASRKTWFVAAVPALAFTVFRLVDPATSGILAIWSTGMTLYLPWPLYTLSLWLLSVTLLVCWRRDKSTASGILLLASGGFASQMTSHALLGLVGLRLVGSNASQMGVDKEGVGVWENKTSKSLLSRSGIDFLN